MFDDVTDISILFHLWLSAAFFHFFFAFENLNDVYFLARGVFVAIASMDSISQFGLVFPTS